MKPTRTSVLKYFQPAYHPLSDSRPRVNTETDRYELKATGSTYRELVAKDDEHPSSASVSPLATRTAGRLRGVYRRYLPTTKWTMIFTLLMLAQSVACIIIGSVIFRLGWDGPSLFSLTLLAHFVTTTVESLYQLVLALEAVRLKNTIQVLGAYVNNLSILVFVCLGMAQVTAMVAHFAEPTYGPWTQICRLYVALTASIAICSATMWLAAWRLYDEFAWAIYRHISAADLQLRRRFMMYEVYIALMHLDFLFLLGLWVQSVALSVMDNDLQLPLLVYIIGLVITPMSLIIGICAVRRESYGWHGIGIFGIFGELGLVILQLVEIYLPGNLLWILGSELRWRIVAYAAMAIPLLLASIVMAVICMANFGKGLKPHIQRNRVPNGSEMVASGHNASGDQDSIATGRSGRRMELD